MHCFVSYRFFCLSDAREFETTPRVALPAVLPGVRPMRAPAVIPTSEAIHPRYLREKSRTLDGFVGGVARPNDAGSLISISVVGLFSFSRRWLIDRAGWQVTSV